MTSHLCKIIPNQLKSPLPIPLSTMIVLVLGSHVLWTARNWHPQQIFKKQKQNKKNLKDISDVSICL
jgi:hypothetical protein